VRCHGALIRSVLSSHLQLFNGRGSRYTGSCLPIELHHRERRAATGWVVPWYIVGAMSISRLLIILGLSLVALGLLWPVINKVGFGRLPGDIVIERDNLRVYIPLATSLLVSVIISLILWLANR
jgi:hypothetical protein